MQSTTSLFTSRANGSVRPLSWQTRISFTKEFLPSLQFFTLDESLLDGPDVLAPTGSDVITEWDKYVYRDFSSRVISFEWTRQEDVPSSVNLAIADVVLDNHDNFFTPNGGSEIQNFILPYRPIRLYAGFGNEDLPVFVGLTEKMPVIDSKNKTVSFHCMDFLSALFSRPLDEAVIYQEYRTDQVLDALFQMVGLTSDQYILDLGRNVISFVYFPKGTKLGDAIRKLMEAEVGRLYMDELGIIRFKNRSNFSSTPVYNIDRSNALECEVSSQDDIINTVEVRSNVRSVQAFQPIWQQAVSKQLPANSSIEVWADFNDPVTSCEDPIVGEISNGSYLVANLADDPMSTEVTSGIIVSDTTLFATSYKMTITNNNAFTVYITSIELWGTPAKIVDNVYVREQDNDSVDKYDERVYSIDNDFVQSSDEAQSLALIIIHDFKDYGSILNIEIKGNPALQMGDAVTVDIAPITDTYVITKIVNKYRGARFTQLLTVKKRTPLTYFTLDVSVLDGPDVLAP